MGNFSPAYYDDQLLHKVKSVVLRVLDELNDVGEIVHARSLAPLTRRSRPVPLSEQQSSPRPNIHVPDRTISNAAGLTQPPDPLARVNVDDVHYTYEQFVTQLDGEDKFLKRLVEILIKETVVQAHERQLEGQRAAASPSSGDAPSPSRTISPPISLSRLARSSLIQRPGVTLRDDGPVPRPLSINVASDDSGATEIPITFRRVGSERDSRVAAGNLFPGSRRRRRADFAVNNASSTSSDEEVEVASTRTFQVGDEAPRDGTLLPEVDLGARFADALRSGDGHVDMEGDMSFTFPPAQPPLQYPSGPNSVPFPGENAGAQGDEANPDSGLASRLTALRASLSRMRALHSEVSASRQASNAATPASTARAASLQRSPAIRLRNSSGNLRRAAAAAAAASAFEDRASTTRMTSLDRSRALGRGVSTTSASNIPWRNRTESGPAELGRSQVSPVAGVRRTDEFAAFAARRRTEARQGQQEQTGRGQRGEGAQEGWAPASPRATISLNDAPSPSTSFNSSIDSNRRDWELELRTIDEHIASIRGRTAALRRRQDELLRSYDRPAEGVQEAGSQTHGFVATVVDEDGRRRVAEAGDWGGHGGAERRIAGQARMARGRADEASVGADGERSEPASSRALDLAPHESSTRSLR